MVCVFRCCPIGKDDETDIRVRKNASVYTRVFFFAEAHTKGGKRQAPVRVTFLLFPVRDASFGCEGVVDIND